MLQELQLLTMCVCKILPWYIDTAKNRQFRSASMSSTNDQATRIVPRGKVTLESLECTNRDWSHRQAFSGASEMDMASQSCIVHQLDMRRGSKSPQYLVVECCRPPVYALREALLLICL